MEKRVVSTGIGTINPIGNNKIESIKPTIDNAFNPLCSLLVETFTISSFISLPHLEQNFTPSLFFDPHFGQYI